MDQNYLINHIQKNYPNLGEIKKIKKIGDFNINSHIYQINSQKSNFVLKISNTISSDQLQKICKIVNFCYKKNIPVLNPIENKKNQFVNTDTNSFLTEYKDGTKFNGSEIQLIEFAKNLAHLHRELKSTSIEYNYRTNQKFWKIIESKELKKFLCSHLHKPNNELDKKILQNMNIIQLALTKYEKINENLDHNISNKQLIHHDLHPNNVLFKSNKVLAIFDFESMRKGFCINDVAFASFRFATFQSSNIYKIKKSLSIFLDSYLQYHELDQKEVKLFNFYILEQILSRLSFILQKRYITNSNLWISDYDKFIYLLKIALKLF